MKQLQMTLCVPVRVMTNTEVEASIARHMDADGMRYSSKIPRERWLVWARRAWELGHRHAYRWFLNRARNAK